MEALRDKINHFLKKSDIVETPFVGQINGTKMDQWNKKNLILLGTFKDKVGEFSLRINAGDEVYLSGIVGVNWEKWTAETIYNIKAMKTGEFKGYPIYQIKVEVA